MTDFSYDTVRRAAGEAVGNLHVAMNELRNSLQSWRRDTNNSEVQMRIYNIERCVNELTPTLRRVDTALQQVQQYGSRQETWRNQFDIQRLEQRLGNIERFAGEISRYLQDLHVQLSKFSSGSGVE